MVIESRYLDGRVGDAAARLYNNDYINIYKELYNKWFYNGYRIQSP